jgi:hypothetical protein
MEEKDNIVLLLRHLTSELHTEVIINEDSTNFWGKAQDYIFDNSLLSFREGIKSLKEGLDQDKDMYNYLSALVFRTFAQSFTEPALTQFCAGFDKTANDDLLSGYTYKAAELSNVEKLLLFFTVHRNLIQLAFYEREAAIAAQAKQQKKR